MKQILSCAYLVVIAAAALAADEQPPLMGWSSWNTYRVNINEQLILKQARLLVELGLKDCGYNHVNIDDGFFGGRDPAGRLKTHPERFPNGLKGIVDGIHSLGLKAGIYSDGGANTCGSFWDKDKFGIGVGFYLHDEEDADYYFREHDFDFIKVDFCGGDPRQNFDKLALDERQRYTAIRRAIDAAKPGVRMNICRWDFPGTWAAELADSWRISHDIRPRWSSVKDIIRQNLYLGAYASRGHYNDMDMLEVGRGMTEVEDHTHFATWCFMSSPLLIGCDLEKVKTDARLRELLADKELIALNQDIAEPQGTVVRRDGEAYVLARDIGEAFGTTRAVLFLNLGDEKKDLSVTMEELDLDPADAEGDAISVSLPPHGATVRRVSGRHRREKRRYEAETAYLPLYQELCNAAESKTAYYRESKKASGGVVVSGAGGRAGNDIVFRRVWSEKGGEYELSIAALGDGAKPAISVNGVQAEVSRVRLNPGVNEIRLSNSGAVLPEIDYIEVVPPGTTASLRLPGCKLEGQTPRKAYFTRVCDSRRRQRS